MTMGREGVYFFYIIPISNITVLFMTKVYGNKRKSSRVCDGLKGGI